MAKALERIDLDARLRIQVAAATRILEREGILDYSGHISARSARGDSCYIQAGTAPRSGVRPDDMVLCDFSGKVLEGAPKKPPVELAIHVEIYKARPDVNAIIHSHLESAFIFTMIEGAKLVPMRARAVRWQSGIPVHPDPSHIKLTEQGEALAKTLGPHHAALIRSHGIVLTAESVPGLLVDAVHFDENATAQLKVLNTGSKALALTDAEMEQINKHEMREFHIGKLWKYYLFRAREAGVIPRDWDDDSE